MALFLLSGCPNNTQTQETSQNVSLKTGDTKVDNKQQVTVIVPPAQIIVSSLSIAPSALSINVGDADKFYATAKLSDGKTDDKILWSSSDSSIATIKDGEIKGIKEGTVVITATSIKDTSISANASVKVNKAGTSEAEKQLPPALVSTLKIASASNIIKFGEPLSLTAVVTLTDGKTNNDVIWGSSDESIARIDSNGNISTISSGNVLINAKAKADLNKITSATVTIIPKEIPSSIPILQPSALSPQSTPTPVINNPPMPTPTVSSSATPTPIPTPTPTSTVTATPTPIPTSTATNTPTPAPTSTPAPQAPSNLSSSNIIQTGFTLNWNSVSGATSYNIYKNSSLYANNVTGTSTGISGLTSSTTYSMQVSAVNAGGESTKSSALSVTTSAPAPTPTPSPQAPSGLSSSSISSTGFTLNWNAVSGSTSYNIYKDSSLYANNVTGTSTGISGLTSSTTYSIQVSAVNSGGESTKSSTLSITTSASGYVFDTKWGTYGNGDGQFNDPRALAIDSSGNIYVADSINHRIQKFNSSGTFITKWGSQGSGNGQFMPPSGGQNSPDSLTIDSYGNVFVEDSGNYRIQKFNSTGTFITKWGSQGTGDGQFGAYINGLAADSSGNIYVGDYANNRIQKFNSSGTFITKWGSYGTGDGQFKAITGVAVDLSGNIYVSDSSNNCIQKFNSSGTFITKWGSYGTGDGQFYSPYVAVDSSGNVFVADFNNHRIQKFNSSGTFITKWGTHGSSDGQFNFPSAVAMDSSGNVFIADSDNNRIQKFRPAP